MMLKKTLSSIFLISLLFSIFTNFNLVDAQLTPARDLTGTWKGTAQYVNSFDYYPKPVTCSVTSDVVIIWTQNGDSFTGSIDYPNKKFASGSDPLCQTVGHAPGPQIGGTISSTSFSGIVYEGVTLKGTFTTDLMSGTIQGSDGAQKWDLSFKAVRENAPTIQSTQTTPQTSPPPTISPQQGTVQGSIKLDISEYVVIPNHTTTVKISGKVNDGRGDRITLTITKPDGSSDQIQAFLTNVGDFTSIFMLDQNSQLGNYKITGDYYGSMFGSATFVVSTHKSTTSSGTQSNIASTGYKTFHDHGILFNYPSDWALVDQSPDKYQMPRLKLHPNNSMFDITIGKYSSSNRFGGVTGQAYMDKLVGESKQYCNNSDCSDFSLVTSQSLPTPYGAAYIVIFKFMGTVNQNKVQLMMGTLDMPTDSGTWTVIPVGTSTDYSKYGQQISNIVSSIQFDTSLSTQEYKSYKNDPYGFSIGYPKGWNLVEHLGSQYTAKTVLISPDDNFQLNAGVIKNNNPYAGLTSQEILGQITSMMRDGCSKTTLQNRGFTCTDPQFHTNTTSYRGVPIYSVGMIWTKTFSGGSSIKWASIWGVMPHGNDVWLLIIESSSDELVKYSKEITRITDSYDISSIPEKTVTPKIDYSNFGLQKGESISYKYSMKIDASDVETQQAVTKAMLQSLSQSMGNVTLNSIDDVQWIKYTITDVSSTNILFNEETKVRDLATFQNQRDIKYLQGMAIPITAKIGDSFDIFSSGAGGMLQGTVNKITTTKIGNTDVPVFELSGSTRNVSQDGATVTTLSATAHYDKKTGLMLDALVDMNMMGVKYVKMHMEVNAIDWSGLGKSGVQPSQVTTAAIPGWIKNTAKWWSEGSLTDEDFVKGIQYLIQNKIIQIHATQASSVTSHTIPAFMKNTAKWWSEGQVSDSDFTKGIQYLVENGIISTTVKPKTLDSTSQVLDTNGGTVSLSGGTNASFPPGTLDTSKTISLTLLSSLPQQPPGGVIVGVGQALVISFGTTPTSYQNLGITPFASAQKESSDPIKITLNAGDLKSLPEINDSLGIADVVDLQGKDHFVGIPEDCNQSYTECTFALQPSVVSVAQKVILSQVNLNTQVTGAVAPMNGPRIWNGQEFVDFPQGFDPTKKTLVITHGMASNVESAYGDCINDIMAAGNYEQVIGFNYDFSQSITDSGTQFADFLNTLTANKLTQIDLEAHSEGTVISLAAASKTSMVINNMILEGGPIDGTPISTAWFVTRLAQSGLWIPPVGYGLAEMYRNSHVLGDLQEGSSVLKSVKDDAVRKQSNTNFIKVVGTKPYLGETKILAALGDPFNGQPNDGMIPVSSAMGKGLPGPTALYYPLTHTSLTCDSSTVKGVGAAVRQHPLPPSTASTTTGTSGTPQGQSGTQGQSVRGCGGYRTCEEYCQYEIGSNYHYDSSRNACVRSEGPSVSSGGVSGGTGGGPSSGTTGGQTSPGTISAAGDLTGHWSGTFNLVDTSAGVTCKFQSTFEADMTQNGNALTGTVSYASASSETALSGGATIHCGFGGLTYPVSGSVSSSSFTITSSDGTLNARGSFTSNLIHGTFEACGAEGCDSGSFSGSKR